MSKSSKRREMFHTNKFQRMLFFPVISAFVIGCCVAWLSIMYALIGNYLSGPALSRFQDFIPWILVFAAGLMMILIFWTLHLSSRYLGAHDRIVKDLDKVLSGEAQGPLKVRRNDIGFDELIKRINHLIERS